MCGNVNTPLSVKSVILVSQHAGVDLNVAACGQVVTIELGHEEGSDIMGYRCQSRPDTLARITWDPESPFNGWDLLRNRYSRSVNWNICVLAQRVGRVILVRVAVFVDDIIC